MLWNLQQCLACENLTCIEYTTFMPSTTWSNVSIFVRRCCILSLSRKHLPSWETVNFLVVNEHVGLSKNWIQRVRRNRTHFQLSDIMKTSIFHLVLSLHNRHLIISEMFRVLFALLLVSLVGFSTTSNAQLTCNGVDPVAYCLRKCCPGIADRCRITAPSCGPSGPVCGCERAPVPEADSIWCVLLVIFNSQSSRGNCHEFGFQFACP